MGIKNNEFNLYSTDESAILLLKAMEANQKLYKRLLQALKLLGRFNSKVEVFVLDCFEDENSFYKKLWLFDENEDIFTIYADSSDKSDLSKIEVQRKSNTENYDLSLAKNFEITGKNLDYLRLSRRYNFKFGMLISDQKWFYNLFLGDNVGFQIQIDYINQKHGINIDDLLSMLNKLEDKPNLHTILNIFNQLINNGEIGFSNIRVIALKNLEIIGEFNFGNSKTSTIDQMVEPTPKQNTPKRSNKTSKVISVPDVIQQSSNQRIESENAENKQIKNYEMKPVIEGNKIYLDQKGYEEFLNELEEAKNKLSAHQKLKNDSFLSSAGDGWHDNFEFEDAERTERLLLGQVREKLEMAQRIVIIDKQDSSFKDVVDINDIVSLTIRANEGDSKTANYLLSGSNSFSDENEYIKISVNSPLGKSIYLQPIGQTVTYSVNGKNFYVTINSKINHWGDQGCQKVKSNQKN